MTRFLRRGDACLVGLLFAIGHAEAAPSSIPNVVYSFCAPGSLGCSLGDQAIGWLPASVASGPDGAFYGITLGNDRPDSSGSLFRVDLTDRTASALFQFPSAYIPSTWVKFDVDGSVWGGFRRDPTGIDTEGFYRISPAGEFTITRQRKYSGLACNKPIEDRFGVLYGVATDGYYGAIPNFAYAIFPNGALKVLHRFEDGERFDCPDFEPVLAVDGNLYGIIWNRRVSPVASAVFRLGRDGTYVIAHAFDRDSDGSPITPLTVGSDGALYGVSELALTGANDVHRLYRLSLDGQFTNLGTISPDFFFRIQKLTLMPDGALYGTGKGSDSGTVDILFRFYPTGEYAQLYVDRRVGTGSLDTPLIRGADDALYGANTEGGRNLAGALFRYVPAATPAVPKPAR